MMKLISAILAANLLTLGGALAAEGESGNPATLSANAPPSITTQPLAAQIINAGSGATLSVNASGAFLTFQWYQGVKGDTSNPVDGNSLSFTTPSLTTNTSYWVRVSNGGGSVDSAESVVVVWPQGIRVGDQFSANLSPLATGGKTLKLVGKLPTGLSLNKKTWQISGLVSGKTGNFTPSIQVIQNKAVLQTISIPISVGNFPTSLLGNYEALLKGQNGAPFGVFKLTTGKNVWTASLETLGQAKRTAKGSFVLQQGAESVSIESKFAATKTASAIALNFTLEGNSPVFLGTYGAGTIEGFKMYDGFIWAYNTKPILYNLILDQGIVDALDKPAGKGWACGSFTQKGGIGTFKGMLGDATACSFSLRLSVTGQAILWAQPYANKNSFIGGVIDLADMVPNANIDEALEPKVSWVKVADSKTLSYPNGFSFENLSISGSRWLVPATHTALGNLLGWFNGEICTLRIYGAGLSSDLQSGTVNLPTEFTLDKAFKLLTPVNASTVKWSGKVEKGTGVFSGSFNLPAALAVNTIAGAGAVSGLLLQDDKWGITTGLGLMKVPINGPKGSFTTAEVTVEQYRALTISGITDQTIDENGNTGALNFTIGDDSATVSSLTLNGISSNKTLVPNSNIVFGGSGANRTVTVSPARGQIGSVTITVTVSNGLLSSSYSFELTVNPIGFAYVAAGTLPSSSQFSGQSVSSYIIAKTETTWGQWQSVQTYAAANGYDIGSVGAGNGTDYPVTDVTWYEAVKWCNARSEMEGLIPVYKDGNLVYKTGYANAEPTVELKANGYRLPTNAEWEFAARGGRNSAGYKYSGSNDVTMVAWYYIDWYSNSTSIVGSKLPNELGIFDMSGNVAEWCDGWYGYEYSGKYYREYRGGSCFTWASECEVGDSMGISFWGSSDDIGFRVVRSINP
jgi:formylglycine-generating enzyme required for sulfatase activity